ncbi:MAG: choice-of-anchor N protein [Desulfuromonadales bacterium]|nr:choice-of-anchor N protein [Desulfuromonadales bacterium]
MKNPRRENWFWQRLFLATLFVLATALSAQAIPTLQIYIEGGSYDSITDTWVTSDGSFKLWVIGDIKSYGSIYDVQVAAAFKAGETGSIDLTSSTTSLLNDPSTPDTPIAFLSGGVGTVPLLGDGSPLPSHGVYGPETEWMSWRLGDFTLKDSPIGDFMLDYPTEFPSTGQVNVYDVLVTGFSWVHFDAYDHIVSGNNGKFKSLNADNYKYVNAPFSHDGEGGGTPVPEPATLLLVGSGLAGLAWARRRSNN